MIIPMRCEKCGEDMDSTETSMVCITCGFSFNSNVKHHKVHIDL